MKDACSPGEHPHSDQRNYSISDYLQMCRDGETKFSVSEVARLMSVSRTHVHRMIELASVSDDEFEEILADDGIPKTLTGLADEVKRRTGKAKLYVESCPHCGGALRSRRR